MCSSLAKFCEQCGHQINEAVEQTSKKAANSVGVELITQYFHRGYPYSAIVGLLEKLDGVRMHVRMHKRKLTVCKVARIDRPHNLYRCETFENLFVFPLSTILKLKYFSLGGSKMVRRDWSLPVNQIAVGSICL